MFLALFGFSVSVVPDSEVREPALLLSTFHEYSGFCGADTMWVGQVTGQTAGQDSREKAVTNVHLAVERTVRGSPSQAQTVPISGRWTTPRRWEGASVEVRRLLDGVGRRFLVGQRKGRASFAIPLENGLTAEVFIESVRKTRPCRSHAPLETDVLRPKDVMGWCRADSVWVGRVDGTSGYPDPQKSWARGRDSTTVDFVVDETLRGPDTRTGQVRRNRPYLHGRGWSRAGDDRYRLLPHTGMRYLVAQAGGSTLLTHPIANAEDLASTLRELSRRASDACVSPVPLGPESLTDWDVTGWCEADRVWVGQVRSSTVEPPRQRGSRWTEMATIVDFRLEQVLRGVPVEAGQVRARGRYDERWGWSIADDDQHRLSPHLWRRYLVAQNSDGDTYLTHPVGSEADLEAAITELDRRTPELCVSSP